MEAVKIECRACGGTGIYSGFAEPEGVAVICVKCRGSGCEEVTFVPFVRRRGHREIHTVRQSRGSFIGTGIGPAGGSITYKEFQQGKMP